MSKSRMKYFFKDKVTFVLFMLEFPRDNFWKPTRESTQSISMAHVQENNKIGDTNLDFY